MMPTNPFSPVLPVAAITRFQKKPLLQTSLNELADYGLAKNSFIISERTASRLDLNLRNPLSFVDIEVGGLSEKHIKVAVLPGAEFD